MEGRKRSLQMNGTALLCISMKLTTVETSRAPVREVRWVPMASTNRPIELVDSRRYGQRRHSHLNRVWE